MWQICPKGEALTAIPMLGNRVTLELLEQCSNNVGAACWHDATCKATAAGQKEQHPGSY